MLFLIKRLYVAGTFYVARTTANPLATTRKLQQFARHHKICVMLKWDQIIFMKQTLNDGTSIPIISQRDTYHYVNLSSDKGTNMVFVKTTS